MDWRTGTLSGTGTATVSGSLGLAHHNGNLTLDGRTLNNLGTATWYTAAITAGNIHLINQAVFNNAASGLFQIENDRQMMDGNGQFNNAGTLVRTAINPGTNDVNCAFFNSGDVELQVFDLIGQQVMNVAKDNLPSGDFEFSINTSQLNKGVYFLHLRNEKATDSKKLIVQ